MILSIQTYGEELNYHPHLDAVITDECFSPNGTFHPIPDVDTQKMMELFRHKFFRMLLAEEKITETQVQKLLAWKHTGFSVYRGEKVAAEDKPGREHLASYILHPPMSQEKMTYDPGTGTVHYRSKKKKGPDVTETFPALDWLARLSAHIPNKWDKWCITMGGIPIGYGVRARKHIPARQNLYPPQAPSLYRSPSSKKKPNATGPG